MVHWLFCENFYPSLTLGALYAPWLTWNVCLSPLRGGLCLLSGKHAGILTFLQTIVNKKMTKNELFFGHPRKGGDPVCLLCGLTFPTTEYCIDLHSDLIIKKIGLFRIMVSCIGGFGRSRKIVRGPRGTNFPPPAPNLSLCPNDFSLQTAPRPWSVWSTYALTGWTLISTYSEIGKRTQ